MKIQPTAHTSIAAVYSDEFSNSSGARYHLVTTYSVMKSVSEVVRARPKSQIFKSQLAFKRRLLGFKSLWRTLAECMYLSPRRIWYRKYCNTYRKHMLVHWKKIGIIKSHGIWKEDWKNIKRQKFHKNHLSSIRKLDCTNGCISSVKISDRQDFPNSSERLHSPLE